jgi:hypothetical protein
MAASSDGVVVTEMMLAKAAFTGNLESLTIWAQKGVRVTSARPLCVAAGGGYSAVFRQLEVVRLLVQQMGASVSQAMPHGPTPLKIATKRVNLALVQCLVVELGADVNQAMRDGRALLITAACLCNLAVVRCLFELGARIGAVDNYGNTALLASAGLGRYATMRYLLEEGGANMDDVNNHDDSVWDKLIVHFEDESEEEVEKEDSLALPGLLRVMVLRDAPPPALVALLPSEPARVVQEGTRLRARLPAYLAHRRAYLDSSCPRISLLPGVLRALIYTFEGPATTEELWATGLGTAP